MLGWAGRRGQGREREDDACRAVVLLFWSFPESTCLMSWSLLVRAAFQMTFKDLLFAVQFHGYFVSINW